MAQESAGHASTFKTNIYDTEGSATNLHKIRH